MSKSGLKYALSAVFLWSTVATAFKLTLTGMNYAQLLFYSSLTSTLIFAFFIIQRKKCVGEILLSKNHIKNNILLGLLNPFLYYLVLFKAYSLLPAQEAQPLNYTWPIIISIFAAIFLKNKINFRIIAGLILAFLGVIIIATRGYIFSLHFHNILGVSLALGSSLLWGLFWTFNLLDSRKEDEKLFGSFFFGTIYTFIYILIFDSFSIISYKYLIGAIYVGFFEMGITFVLWLRALRLSENKARTATLAYLSPFISLLFIWLILGEKMMLSSIAGLVLIVSGIIIQRLNDSLPN
ncbi:DMT family transporter [Melioribacter sp. OK-6-Me]|uniref:DMT family transporter n=1 Tax=unclassified Melioribacter TaxID=2627329 RepID=UPI003EDAEBDE